MMQRHFSRNCASLSVIALLGTAACSRTGDTPADTSSAGAGQSIPASPTLPDGKSPAELVAALDSTTLSKLEQRHGEWKDANASSTWKAWVSHGSIRVIDERVTAGESTRRVMHYFTSDGHLASHIETRNQIVISGGQSSRQFVLMSLDFAGDSVARSSRSVNGETQPVTPSEIASTRKHADVLLAAALVAPAVLPARP
jgi:hypothetical protein